MKHNIVQLHKLFTRTSLLMFALFATLAALSQVPRAAAAQEPTFTAITDSPISEAYAFSAAWGDYDGDGFLDLLMADPYQGFRGGTQIYIFRNQGDGSFEKRFLDPALFPHTGYLNGASWADYDNDGRLDILIDGGGLWVGPEPSVLLHQEPDGSFTRSSSPSFPSGYSQSGLFADFDNDGLLDIFSGYFTESWPTADVTDILYRNNGDGTFTDVQPVGIDQLNNNDDSALAAATGDFNGDGLTDILVTTINPPDSRLYLSNGDLSFERILVTPSAPEASGFGANAAHGLAVADYDNDGDLDFLTVSKSGEFGWGCACDGDLEGRTMLWRNDGSGEFEQVVAGDLGTEETIGANSASWADYNNDGWLDLVLFRGFYSDGRNNNPADLLFRNNGDGTFTRITEGPIVNENGDARAGAWGDIDNDGDMDLVVANYRFGSAGSNLYPVLYRNEGNDNHWLTLDLSGTTANRDAIGAKVRVKATINGEEVWQLREVRTGTGWIASQNDMRPHFGLGNATVVEVVRIEWPSGVVQEMENIAVDQILHVVESSAPQLSIEPAIILSWPMNADGYALFGADTVEGPWVMIDAPVDVNGTTSSVTITTREQMQFYQLRMP